MEFCSLACSLFTLESGVLGRDSRRFCKILLTASFEKMRRDFLIFRTTYYSICGPPALTVLKELFISYFMIVTKTGESQASRWHIHISRLVVLLKLTRLEDADYSHISCLVVSQNLARLERADHFFHVV